MTKRNENPLAVESRTGIHTEIAAHPTPAADEYIQMERIVASPCFAKSERLRRFLRFTVAAKVRGEASILKESVLAIEVFDRDHTYDPRVDSVVRVQASRLRLKLQEYYRTEGADDVIEIAYPRGSYVPEFHRRFSPQTLSEPAPPVEPSTFRFGSIFSEFPGAWRVSLLLMQIVILWSLLSLLHKN